MHRALAEGERMSKITVIRPVDSAGPPATVVLAPREALPEHPVIGLVDNRKPHARELLELLAEELRGRLGDAEILLVRKPGAGHPLEPEQASDMAARAHMVITGVGD
jgi:hypothetical protein